MRRLLIIANRLPIKVTHADPFEYTASEGGLATGLRSLSIDLEIHWIGWPGIFTKRKTERKNIEQNLAKNNIHPVFLTKEQIELFYEGYCNDTIWPLFHYFYAYTVYNEEYYETYKQVNRLFMEKTIEIANDEDIIWVQDYQLLLLPGMLRKRMDKASIGFFLHIPFPSYELFRLLPERRELLEGLLGADLIGFHTYGYMRHFQSAVYRIMGYENKLNEFVIKNRVVEVDTFPMGIDFDKFNQSSLMPEIKLYIDEFSGSYGKQKVIFSVDRLDYSKGIINRLKGFELFLERNPSYKEKISLVILVVPSRDNVENYRKLKNQIDQTIGKINGKHSTLDWMPVHYLYRSLSFEQLSAMYHISDIALVTPLRDGMNLVAKEYVACQKDSNGVLILSEMAGSAVELTQAIQINPNNISEISGAILEALEMPDEEKKKRIQLMQNVIRKQNIQKWADDFIKELDNVATINRENSEKVISLNNLPSILNSYRSAQNRLIILDYDGTLVPFFKQPEEAIPSQRLLEVLTLLTSDPKNEVVINSGRSVNFLEHHFGYLSVKMVAEHGAFCKEDNQWKRAFEPHDQWKEEIMLVMQKITDKTPGSFIEEKESGLVWHFRNTDVWLADLRETQLMKALVYPCTRNNLHLMKGNKIIEVKISEMNKGIATKKYVEQNTHDFILAMGDDVTDEDIFIALPESAITIKIGNFSEKARYNLKDPSETINFLTQLMEE